MEPLFLIAQACGIGGLILLFVSFQTKTTQKICLAQSIACVFFVAQFSLLGAWTGAALNGLSLVRNLVYANNDKKWASGIYWPIGFSVINAIFVILTWSDIFSLLPAIAMVVSNFALQLKNAQLARAVNFPASPLWLVYDLHTKAYMGVFNEIMVMSSILLGLWRYRKEKKAK